MPQLNENPKDRPKITEITIVKQTFCRAQLQEIGTRMLIPADLTEMEARHLIAAKKAVIGSGDQAKEAVSRAKKAADRRAEVRQARAGGTPAGRTTQLEERIASLEGKVDMLVQLLEPTAKKGK